MSNLFLYEAQLDADEAPPLVLNASVSPFCAFVVAFAFVCRHIAASIARDCYTGFYFYSQEKSLEIIINLFLSIMFLEHFCCID